MVVRSGTSDVGGGIKEASTRASAGHSPIVLPPWTRSSPPSPPGPLRREEADNGSIAPEEAPPFSAFENTGAGGILKSELSGKVSWTTCTASLYTLSNARAISLASRGRSFSALWPQAKKMSVATSHCVSLALCRRNWQRTPQMNNFGASSSSPEGNDEDEGAVKATESEPLSMWTTTASRASGDFMVTKAQPMPLCLCTLQ
mmetsp:Transcript_121190/g.270620  ORF Transcript_121190/g.270620 Transcript_121190/m.270620 type:complete len:202 (-) Transcript_121190:163-768(-)